MEDEQDMQTMLNYHLTRWGYDATSAANASDAVDHISEHGKPDIILLDWQLPGLSGIDFLKNLRSDPKLKSVPVLMLTARTTLEDRVRGLVSGADDYLLKPFSPRELRARIQALLRRCTLDPDDAIAIGNINLHVAIRMLVVDGEEKKLGKPETAILLHLAKRSGAIVNREQLLGSVWSQGNEPSNRSLDVYISRLRKALKPYDGKLETLHGVGYRLVL